MRKSPFMDKYRVNSSKAETFTGFYIRKGSFMDEYRVNGLKAETFTQERVLLWMDITW